MGTVPIRLARPRPEPQDASLQDESELFFPINEEEYASEMRVLQDITVKSIQSMLRDLYQREEAVPEYCYLSLEDHVRLNQHDRNTHRLFRDVASMSVEKLVDPIVKIVNPITGTLCTLLLQRTYSQGTLMFYWRRTEKQSRPKANTSIISIVER